MLGGIPCIPDSHPYRVTSTKCHINTVVSPDDGHIVDRNIQRKEINILRKIVYQVGFIYKDERRLRIRGAILKLCQSPYVIKGACLI